MAPPTAPPEPRPRRRFGRLAAIIAAGLVFVLLVGGLGLFWLVRRTLPASGTRTLTGLQGIVQVTQDDLGVQRIFADSATDLFQAQGYLDAANRFFQMDYRRHVATGRLAELVGDTGTSVGSDLLIRTMGWAQTAAAEWEILDSQTRAYLQAYADGVNAYLAGRAPESVAVEYIQLRRDFGEQNIEFWSPIDSLVLLKAIAWEMRSNIEDELDRALAYTTLGEVSDVERLFPSFVAGGNPPILLPSEATLIDQLAETAQQLANTSQAVITQAQWGDNGDAQALTVIKAALNAVPPALGSHSSIGSNAFVVSGRFTESGAPILANDLHLQLTVPSAFAQVGLHCRAVSPACPFDVAGFSFAGFPAIWVGHNEKLAWGVASLRADTADLFYDVLRDDETFIDDEWRPLTIRSEEVKVAGGISVPITIRSVNGRPIISDVIDLTAIEEATPFSWVIPGYFGVSLRWAALEPGHTASGIFAMNLAETADDVLAAAGLLAAPAQSIVFATTAGDIGYQAAGLIPIRQTVSQAGVAGAIPQDGTWPKDGRSSANDWNQWVPVEQLPRALNPERGYLIAANQPPVALYLPPTLGTGFDYGFRAARIAEIIEGYLAQQQQLTTATVTAIQNDDYSAVAAELLPFLLELDLGNDWAESGQNLLRDWDYRMDADSPAAAYFSAVWQQVLEQTFWDELPQGVWPDGSSRWLVVIQELLISPNDDFWDDRSTPHVVETRDEILQNAMLGARNQLTTRVSGNPTYWRWAALHRLELTNPVLGTADRPFWLRLFANPRAVSPNGDTLTVNSTTELIGLDQTSIVTGPVFRMAVDLGNFDNSVWVNLPGNSGHAGSGHYADQLDAWLTGQTYPFYFRSSPAAQEFAVLAPGS